MEGSDFIRPVKPVRNEYPESPMIAFATNLRKRRLRSLSAYQAPDNSLVIGTCPKVHHPRLSFGFCPMQIHDAQAGLYMAIAGGDDKGVLRSQDLAKG